MVSSNEPLHFIARCRHGKIADHGSGSPSNDLVARSLPELAPYRTLRRPAEHAAQGIFVAEGDKVVRRLLASDFGVLSVLLPENRVAEFLTAARGAAGTGNSRVRRHQEIRAGGTGGF